MEEEFIIEVAPQLRNFKRTKPRHYKCSCPICGDSAKDKSKARGNFFIYKGDWVYHCYNCGISHTIPTFLKNYFPEAYDKYLFAKFGTKRSKYNLISDADEKTTPSLTFVDNSFFDGAINLLQLDKSHVAYQTMVQRKIPLEYLAKMYFVPKFMHWVNQKKPGTFANVHNDSPRVIIPFYNKQNQLIALQGRSISPDVMPKYLTVKIADNTDTIFGLDTVDPDMVVYVLEGPIDSMFVDNGIALATASKSIRLPFPNVVFVWDNEPYNPHIVGFMDRAIKEGKRVVIWDKKHTHKDINDMVLAGYSKAQIAAELVQRTFQGLQAQLQFSTFRKV